MQRMQGGDQGDDTGDFCQKVLYQLDDLVCVWDTRKHFLYVNEGVERLTGVACEAYRENSPGDLAFLPDRVTLFEELLPGVIETGEPYRGRAPETGERGTGGVYEYVLTPIKDDMGTVEYITSVSREITARASTDEALRESEAHYRLLLESIDQGFGLLEVIRDEQGNCRDFRLLKANPALWRHTGISGTIGKTQREILPHLEEKWLQAWCRVAQTGQAEHFVEESALLGRWFDASVFPVEGPGSRHIALLFFDITERMQVEQEMEETDKRKDEFLATLAHELRNPLAAISSGLEILQINPEDKPRHADVIDTLARQTQQLVVLVDDLLEVSRVTRGKLTLRKDRVSFPDIAKNAVDTARSLINGARHQLHIDLPPGPLPVYADPNRLAQVIANLLSNAAKFTPEGGRIHLSAEVQGSELVIRVADNGIGIPRDRQRAIFDLFSQVSSHDRNMNVGLGLGLTLAKALVEMHEGTIEVFSEGEGRGSTFVLRLPILVTDAPGSERDQPESGQSECQSRVLVVDDNQDAARMLALVTELMGCQVKAAYSGEEAIDVAASFHPDLILMDLGMPEMDGYETARRIRDRDWGKQARIVALSGWGQEQDKRRSHDAGFDEHLLKPLKTTTLKALLHVPGGDSDPQSRRASE